MTDKVIERVTDEEKAAATAAEQAAFDGVFSGESTSGEDSDDSQEDDQKDQDDDQAKSEQQTAETPPETRIAGMTEAQITELLRHASRVPELEKQLRDAGGRYGGLKQDLEALQRARANGLSGKVTAERFKKLSDQFPEIAELLVEDLSSIFDGSQAGGLDQDEIDRMISSGVQNGINKFREEQKAELEERDLTNRQNMLSKRHPDWFTVRETPQFKTWLNGLSHADAIEFSDSEDPQFVADKLDEFKASLTTQPPENKQRQQQRRIERAIQPDGSKAAPKRTEVQSEQEAFDAVFKKRKS